MSSHLPRGFIVTLVALLLATAAIPILATHLRAQEQAIKEALDEFFANEPKSRYRYRPDQLPDNPAEHYLVVDARTDEEFRDGHLPGAMLIPFNHLTAVVERLPRNKETPILLYCRSARRTEQGMMALRLLGYRQVYHIRGGIEAWKAAGKPIEKGETRATGE